MNLVTDNVIRSRYKQMCLGIATQIANRITHVSKL